MRSILRNILMLNFAVFSFLLTAHAQVQYSSTIEIQELLDSTYTDYPVLFEMNTIDLVNNGFITTANDFHFALDCAGNDTIPYFIEASTFPSANTKIWLRLPAILAHTSNIVYYFVGDQIGQSAENSVFNTLNYQTIDGGGVTALPNANPFFEAIIIENGTFARPISNGAPLVLRAHRIIIDNGGIYSDAGGTGIGGGNPGGAAGLSGMGPGGGVAGATRTGAGGAGYGNAGGDGGAFGPFTPGGIAYNPPLIDVGSGGGGGVNVPGGAGGGGIMLFAQDIQIRNSSSFLADGEDGAEDAADSLGTGGGSGGGILVSGRYVSIAGASMSAIGGDGGSDLGTVDSFGAGGAGSGGRVKVFYYEKGDTSSLALDVSGGAGGLGGSVGVDGLDGGDGTVNYEKRFNLNPFTIKVNSLISTQPAIISGADTICEESVETYSASVIGGNNYFWQVTGGVILTDSTTNQIDVEWTTSGNDTVTLVTTNSFLGCSDTVIFPVFVSPNNLVANFSVTNTCVSAFAQFTSTSTPANIVSYAWDFDDGNTSVSPNPTHLYSAAGIYSVVLMITADNGCVKDTIIDIVIEEVSADFTVGPVCLGMPTIFTNASMGATSYTWDFGDGNTSNLAAPNYTYTSPGTYTVILTAVSDSGCTDVFQRSVTVNPAPKANFSFINACPGNQVTFTNLSSITSGTLTYSWDFGDGDTSNLADPSHTYATPGSYDVELIATSGFGCADTVTKTVVVFDGPVANFIADTACFGVATNFTNTSTNAGTGTLLIWDFGDGSGSTNLNPNHIYSSAGTYNVTLTATTVNGCTDDTTLAVLVNMTPVPVAVVDPVCFGDSFRIKDQSTNLDAGAFYEIDFYNDGIYDAGPVSPGDSSYISTIVGVYPVKLRATNGNGCQDSIIGTVTIYPAPQADFVGDTVCYGNDVELTNNTTIPTNPIFSMHPSTIDSFPNAFQNLSYLWNFGDGSGASNAISPAHGYTGPTAPNTDTTFTVRLVAVSEHGCVDTAFNQVKINLQPEPDFVVDGVCFGDSTKVIDLSTGLDAGASYEIDYYNDGIYDVGPLTPGDTSVLIPIVGVYDAKLRVTNNNGCRDSISGIISVYPQPIAAFDASNVCEGSSLQFDNNTIVPTGPVTPSNPNAPLFVPHPSTMDNFTNALQNTNYEWDFGDGFTNNALNPDHVYSMSGPVTVNLIAVSEHGCADTVSNTFVVFPKPEAGFLAELTCFGDSVQFNDTSRLVFGTRTYSWDFGDGGISTVQDPLHFYNALSTYEVTQTVTSDQGCKDSVIQDVTIYPNPTANFIANDACLGDSIRFLNVSSTSSGSLGYIWDFGDGDFSIEEEPVKYYNSAGPKVVTLIVNRMGPGGPINGCVDTTMRTVNVDSIPRVSFTATPGLEICFGDTITFVRANPLVPVTNTFWDFGDGGVSQQRMPTHYYSSPGAYVVTLYLTSVNGCMDSTKKTIIVRALPDAEIFNQSGPLAFCDGGSVTLQALPPNVNDDHTYTWNTQESAEQINVNTSGTYCVTVTEVATGCQDTACTEVTVWELPNVVAYIGNDTARKDTLLSLGYDAPLNAIGAFTYEWSPVDSLSNPFIANPFASPNFTTVYTVTGTDTNSCENTDFVTVFIDTNQLVEPYNVITPNEDGFNDTWSIINIESYPAAEVLIFDRWGTKIYEANPYDNNNGWDGKYQGRDLPQGTYYYVIRFEGFDRLYKGSVSIIR